jgi:glycosyltransferase involved in cell wall biosynthesis
MRALPEILRRRPKAHVLVVGGDEVSYGKRLPRGDNWRTRMLAEVTIDPERVHFLGRIPYEAFVGLLHASSVHVYLTYPFVLSWSMLEAMACGCLVIGSATPPVQEVIRDRENGLLVDFFSTAGIADRVDEVLDHPDRMADVRAAARRTIVERYDLRRVCLPRFAALINRLVAGEPPEPRDAAPLPRLPELADEPRG